MDMNGNFVHIWKPFESLTQQQQTRNNNNNNNNNSQLALIILNQPIAEKNDLKFVQLWKRSAVRFCVDGGANQLNQWQKQALNKHDKFCDRDLQEIQDWYPDYICGDFDSIDSPVIEHYKLKGAKCFQLKNQDLNDFQKTIRFAVNCVKEGLVDEEIVGNSSMSCKYPLTKGDLKKIVNINFDQIYSVCGSGGRIDHSIANLHSLYLECIQTLQTYILSEESVSFLLKRGINIIYVDNESYCDKYCGYFPLGHAAKVTTFGLRWDVVDKPMQFGVFVSSSNQFSSDQFIAEEERQFIAKHKLNCDISRKHVIIETDQPLIWTMSIK